MSLLTYRIDNPRRPADWRWQRANVIQNAYPRQGEDVYMRIAVQFMRMIRRCGSDEDLLQALDANPLLFEAYSIYTGADDVSNIRWEIEARILADEDQASIASKLGISTDIVDYYERFFFDVRDRLQAWGLITHAVIRFSARAGLASRSYDCFWKLIGYWCGPIVLDALIYGFNHPQRPASKDQLRTSLQEIAKDTVSVKATTSLLTMQVNEDTQEMLLDLWSRLLELESKADSAGGGDNNILANIDTLISNMSFMQFRPDLQAEHKATETELERAGITPRASERLSSNQSDISNLLSAKYPEPANSNE